MVQIAAAALAATRFREARLREAAQDPALVATEVADYLVAQGVPFREAHEIVGKVLRAAEQEGKSIREMPLDRLRQFSPAFGRDLSTVAHARIGARPARRRGRHGAGRRSRCARRFQRAACEARGKSVRARVT